MSRIIPLPLHEVQKIAAGEVVDRPANVLKELIENALDAGATQLSIFIEDGGKSLIRLIDNGCGMDPVDAHMCLVNHATSKIRSVEDLATVATYGFRGEALASISAVSTLTLITREAQQNEGIKLTVDAGSITKEEFVAAPVGTDIAIANLFHNVPARKKFLKTRETEWRAIQQLCYALCLAYPLIDIKLYHENSLILNASPVHTLQERVAQLFDTSWSRNGIACSESVKDFSLRGFISTAQYMRYDRNQTFLFVNNRWIKNQKISQALMRGYVNMLPPARYPAAVLFIEIDKTLVDINIHPRKEEVQFLHPRLVEQATERLIKKSLEEHTSTRITGQSAYTPSWSTPIRSFDQVQTASPVYGTYQPRDIDISMKALRSSVGHHQQESVSWPAAPVFIAPENAAATCSSQELVSSDTFGVQHTVITPSEVPTYTLLGQLLTTYLQIETEEGLVMIDQHAAHERILYEEFKDKSTLLTTALLFPEIFTLAHEDITVLLSMQTLLHEHGIICEQIAATQIAVTHAPAQIKNISCKELILQMLAWIREERHIDTELLKKNISGKLYAQMACKAAIKAGDQLSQEQMHSLIKQLYAAPNRFSCPHGRPTSWLISQYEIERKFKRKV